MAFPELPSWFIFLLIIIALAIIQIYDLKKRMKLKKQLLENAPLYTAMIVNVAREIDLPRKEVLSPEENEKLIEVVEKMPQVFVVKDIMNMLKIYRVYIHQHPEVLEEKIAIRKSYTIPLMYKLLVLFSYMDENLHAFINERIEHYNREGKTFEETVPAILSEVIEKVTKSEKASE
mgnify:CR=1 FL=1